MLKLPSRHAISKFFAEDNKSADDIAPCSVVRRSRDLVVAVFPVASTTKEAQSTADIELKPCVVSDGKDYIRAYLLGTSFVVTNPKIKSRRENSITSKPFLLRVTSFIAGASNPKEPLLFITSGEILQAHCRNIKKPPLAGTPSFRPFSLQQQHAKGGNNGGKPSASNDNKNNLKIQGGVAPNFFQNWAPVLRNEALSGCCARLSREARPDAPAQQHAKTVANFLEHHNAIRALHSSSSSHAMSMERSGEGNMQYYMSALNEFRASQLDRQLVSLVSNSGREDAKKATLIEQQYIKALQLALGQNTTQGTQQQAAPHLSSNTICFWHSVLCGEGIHPEAGRLRSKKVRVGHVHFRPCDKVARDFDSVFNSLRTLEGRLLEHNHLSTSQQNRENQTLSPESHQSRPGWNAAAFAASVFFSIVDVHGFADGNGRLARIALNWALQKAGIPFPVHLFATPTQRKEYTEAISQTRRNIALISISLLSEDERSTQSFSQNNNDLMVYALECAGALSPLVDLVLDRLAKAISEFEKAVEEKSRLVSEEAEARAAKKVRDRERAGTCLICFEESPNIATLCCGKAVHLNCMAQWLSSNATCPNCRENFPVLPPRMQAPSARDRPDEVSDEDISTTSDFLHDEDDDDTSDTTSIVEMVLQAGGINPENMEDEHSVSSDDDTTSVVLLGAAPPALRADQQAENESDGSETETMEIENAAGSDIDSTSSTTEIASAPQVPPLQPPQANDESSTYSTASTSWEEVGSSDDSEEVAPAAPTNELPPFCFSPECRNRAARDCENRSCGRCCILHGRYHCFRHMQEPE